jgi:hypothetical protein
MANFRVSTDVRTGTWTMDVGTADANYPVTNLGLTTKPFRTWRSTDTTTHRPKINLGSEITVGAVFINVANFTTVVVETASSAGTDWSPLSISWPLNLDTRVNRRKVWVHAARSGVQYIRVTPSVPLDSFYEIGTVAVLGTVTTFADSFAFPRAYQIEHARTVTPTAGGGVSVSAEGDPYLTYRLNSALFIGGVGGMLGQLYSVVTAGGGAQVVLYENLGDVAHAYLLHRIEDAEFQERANTFGSGLVLQEAM